MRTITWLWFVPAALLAACESGKDSEGASCAETVTELALDEVSALGFSGGDVAALATMGSPWAETFTWDAGGTTPLTLTVGEPTGGARYVDAEPEYPEGESPAIGVECPDRVEVDVAFTFVTDDGAFDEGWTGPLASQDGGSATVSEELDPNALGGTFDLAALVTEPDYDELRMWIDGSFDAGGTTGAVHAQVSGEEECVGDECSAWASEVPVGGWGAVEE